MTLLVHHPAAGTTLHVTVEDGATVEDLCHAAAAAGGDPLLKLAKMVFNGKVLAPATRELRAFGIGAGSNLHAAAGQFADTRALELLNVAEGLVTARARVTAAPSEGDAAHVAKVRKTVTEDCMRLLFRLDNLDDLEGDQRQERRRLVKEVNAVIDLCGASSPV